MIINLVIGIPIGIVSAVRQFSWYDYFGRAGAIGLLAVPNFWIALLAISLAGKYALWAVPTPVYPDLFEDPISNLKFMAFPALLTGAAGAGYQMRFGRTAMLEVMRQDYIRTAWSKGLQERAVILKHGLRNALIPIVTVIGLFLPALIGGTVVIETIYSIPGMGRYFIHALNGRDLFIVQALAVIFTLVVIVSNFLVDIAYSILNPRIRYS
jgi:peptide/nickel transport system permease protein